MKRKTRNGLLSILIAACATLVCVACRDNGDKTAPTISLACKENYLAAVGSYFTIPTDEVLVMDNVDEVEAEFAVTYGGKSVEIKETKKQEKKFEITEAGVYTVTVSATDKSGNRAEKEISVHTSKEDEINSFDDEIRVQQAVAKGFAEVSLNKDPAYIKAGEGSLKLQVESHNALGWPGVIIEDLPINDILDYYSISFWAYNDGNDDVLIYLHRNDTSEKARFTLSAKMWTKVEVRARDYDSVFRVAEATSWGEPACGMCEDMQCFTFHFINPANSPQFDIYVDSLQVNKSQVFDTLEIDADIKHPVVGVEYTMPTVTAQLGGETVAAQISYELYDEAFNAVTLTENKVTLTAAGKYTLLVQATYEGITSKKSYMLVCASSRADNEIDFFEEDTSLHFFKSEHMSLSVSKSQAQANNNSTASLKIGKSDARWPYLTIGNVPYADLEGVAYIWFYAKTDAEIKDTETPYIGIRSAKMQKVLKRMTLTNEWKCFTLTKEELLGLGVETLNGLQISIELKDATNPKADGGWCPITFNTYVDNFTVGKVSEPTEKAENVVLDFANYRDLDDLSSNYISYNFYDLEKTVNGVGSMKVTAAAKWPEIKMGSSFAKFTLDEVRYILLDVYVPTIADTDYIKIGMNDSNYQKILPENAGKWVQIKFPVAAAEKAGTGSLQSVKLNPQRVSSGSTVNLGTLYIGKISLEKYEVDPEAATHVKPGNVLYDFYDRKEATKLVCGSYVGEKVIMDDGTRAAKLVMTSAPWQTMTLPAEADEKFSVSEVNYLYLNVYVSTTMQTGESVRCTYYTWTAATETAAGKWTESHVDLTANTWYLVRIPVHAETPALAQIKFSFQKKTLLSDGTSTDWRAIGSTSGDALYIGEVGVLSNTKAYGDYTGSFESTMDMSMFYATNESYKMLINENAAYVKEGAKSLHLKSVPRWPRYYFTDAFINWVKEKGYTSIKFDIYIDSAEGNAVTQTEGVIYSSSPTNNAWYTVTVKASAIVSGAYIQFNHEKESTINIYIDNMQFVS